MQNRKIVLKQRPHGQPREADFALVEETLGEPGPDQVLVAVEHLSVDAFIRTMLDQRDGFHGSIALDTPVVALGVGTVAVSHFPGLAAGDAVFGPCGAQTHVMAPGGMFRKLDGTLPARSYLGLLGMTTGLTAYAGMMEVGQAGAGDTVVVSAAAGAVGSIACQLGRIAGARVIGIAGGSAKCRYLTDRLGCDGAIDYKAGGVAEQLRRQAPDGVDVYFDNVGGELLDTVLDQLAVGARVVICGAVSQYNDMTQVRGPSLYLRIAERNARMLGFTVDHFSGSFPEMERQLSRWAAEGRLEMVEHVVSGIENFPQALVTLLTGGHTGKLIVEI